MLVETHTRLMFVIGLAHCLVHCNNMDVKFAGVCIKQKLTHAVEAFLLSVAAAQRTEHKHISYATLEWAPLQKVLPW